MRLTAREAENPKRKLGKKLDRGMGNRGMGNQGTRRQTGFCET